MLHFIRSQEMTDMERSGMEVVDWLRSNPERGENACIQGFFYMLFCS